MKKAQFYLLPLQPTAFEMFGAHSAPYDKNADTSGAQVAPSVG